MCATHPSPPAQPVKSCRHSVVPVAAPVHHLCPPTWFLIRSDADVLTQDEELLTEHWQPSGEKQSKVPIGFDKHITYLDDCAVPHLSDFHVGGKK